MARGSAADPFDADDGHRMKSGRAPLSRFVPYPNNPRTHPPAQLGLLAELLKRHGPDQPIVVDEKWVILKGHGRRSAALLAGLEDFPYVQHLDLPEAEKIAMRMADNQSALLSGWDRELARGEVVQLQQLDYEVALLGFPELQLRGWDIATGTQGLVDPEATPEPPKKPVSRRGDLWLLGDHRLLCGDATSESDVATCLGNVKPHLMVTDPPYGVDYDPDWRNRADRANGKPYGASAVGLVSNDNRIDWREAWALFPGAVAYVWHAVRHASLVDQSLQSVGFEVAWQIIWAKTRLIIGRGDYHLQHEPCWYTVRKGEKHYWIGDRSQTTLWTIEHQKSETGHSTQKPIECMKRPMENNSRKGDHVYDPFIGSGTSIIAAEMTGRKALGLEIDPAYIDVAVIRWQNFVGKQARLKGSGTYEEVKQERENGARRRNANRSKGASVRTARAGNGLRAPRVAPIADV